MRRPISVYTVFPEDSKGCLFPTDVAPTEEVTEIGKTVAFDG